MSEGDLPPIPTLSRPASTRRVPRIRKTSELIARMILQDILETGAAGGRRLGPESEMVEYYDVGRATIREALRILEVQGVIEVKVGPNGGPVTRDLTPQDFAQMAKLHLQLGGATFGDIIDARLIIEPMMAGLAAERSEDSEIAELKVIVERGPEGLDDDEQWVSATRDFHYAIAGMSGNPVLNLVARSLKEIFESKSRHALAPPDGRCSVQEAHERVLAAISEGDSPAAETAMREHMVEYADLIRVISPEILPEPIEWD